MQLFENCIWNKLIVSAPVSYREKEEEKKKSWGRKKKHHRRDNLMGWQTYPAITGMPERSDT